MSVKFLLFLTLFDIAVQNVFSTLLPNKQNPKRPDGHNPPKPSENKRDPPLPKGNTYLLTL
jgi:hypothetical protein